MTTSGSPDRIDEELVSIDALVHRLREVDPDQVVFVREEPDDPPDFWVTIGGAVYAAEVTSIVTDQGYAALCGKLLDDIRARAVADGLMKGTYALAIRRHPEIPRRRRTQWHQLVSESLAILRTLCNSPPGTEECLFENSNGRLSLPRGSSDTEGRIGLVRSPGLKWEGETQEDLADRLQKAIDTKRAKVGKKGILDRCPNVFLIFYDAYGYAGIEDAQRAFAAVRGYEWLHSVFWAASFSDRQNTLYPDEPGRSGVFLYSKNRSWM